MYLFLLCSEKTQFDLSFEVRFVKLQLTSVHWRCHLLMLYECSILHDSFQGYSTTHRLPDFMAEKLYLQMIQ